MFVGIEEPVADELGQVFTGAEAGVEANDFNSRRSFVFETVFHVIGVDFAVFGGEVGKFMKGGAGTVGIDGDEFFGIVGDAAGFIAGQNGSGVVAWKLKANAVAK